MNLTLEEIKQYSEDALQGLLAQLEGRAIVDAKVDYERNLDPVYEPARAGPVGFSNHRVRLVVDVELQPLRVL